jgi:hypothetical protein
LPKFSLFVLSMASASIPITLSLDPYERKLLDEFAKLYERQMDDVIEESTTEIQDVFSRWLWRRKVFDNFHDLTHQKRLVEDMSGNVEAIWPTYLHFLHYYVYNFLYFRTDALKVDNPDVIERIKNATTEQPLDLDTQPAEDHLRYWMLLAKLSGDNMMGVVNWEDMTLEELARSIRPPLRTAEEQQSSASLEEWETTDDSEDGKLEDTTDGDASIARGEPEADGEESDKDRSGEEPVEDPESMDVDIWQHRTDQQPEATDSPVRSSSKAADDDDDIFVPFEVYALLRKVSILHRRQRNADPAFECINDGEFGKYYVKATEGVFVADPRPETLRTGLSAMTTHLGMINHLSIWGDQGFVGTRLHSLYLR